MYRSTHAEWDAVDRDIKDLNIPIFMAPGNHDVAGRKLFKHRYAVAGKNYFSRIINNDVFIVLDANLAGWNISGEQLLFFKQALNDTDKVNNIFIFVHQIIWHDKKKYRYLFYNSKQGRAKALNFWSEILPIMKQAQKPVYIFAGDTGVQKHHFPTYDHLENVHFISSGMGGGVNDNYVLVEVGDDGLVDLEFIWLKSREDINTFSPY